MVLAAPSVITAGEYALLSACAPRTNDFFIWLLPHSSLLPSGSTAFAGWTPD
jgi:hypothetical protein